jgi:hypothetical protein
LGLLLKLDVAYITEFVVFRTFRSVVAVLENQMVSRLFCEVCTLDRNEVDVERVDIFLEVGVQVNDITELAFPVESNLNFLDVLYFDSLFYLNLSCLAPSCQEAAACTPFHLVSFAFESEVVSP